LTDDSRRAAYLEQLSRGSGQRRGSSGPRPTSEEAKKEAAQGEMMLRKKDHASAEKHFTRAYELDPRAEYLAGKAWAIYLDPARKADVEQVKSLLAEALRLDGDCDRAHYYGGVIARVEEDMELAERFFRNAIRVNPKHTEALAELRLIEMRRQKTDKPKKKGFFG
jgi:cytochrome c-type biogenesis protein CcmH/NrfG